ncbi:unnamed protein product, partial [Adineta ricciae]
MAESVTENTMTTTTTTNDGEAKTSIVSSTESVTSLNEPMMLDTTTRTSEQQISVVDDGALQAVLSSMTEPEMHAFLEELNKTGKAYLPSIGQTIELLTVPTPIETSTAPPIAIPTPQSSSSAAILLQELTTLIQHPPNNIVPIEMQPNHPQQTYVIPSDSHQAHNANTYVGSSGRPGTAVKSTVSSNNRTAIRKSSQQASINDDRMFFGRSPSSNHTTIGQGQYHNRIGLMANRHSQVTISSAAGHHHQSAQRRPLSWNRFRRHSSGDELDSDLDLSPPSCSINSNDNQGPTRRSTRIPKPKQDADFVTFPLLDRDEQENQLTPTPLSMPLHKVDDDEDDIPYRLMDYPRPSQQSQSSSTNPSMTLAGPGRKPRTVAELRATAAQNKKQPRWADDELYHVKSYVPLIMPQQITNPSTMKNKMTMCKPLVSEREVEAKPTRFTIATQTEMEHMIPDVPLVTLPVPIYLPSPTPSYRLFQPRVVPIPVPVFVPVMIPVPRQAYKNIREYLQAQRDLLPDDPFEAALVLHAESLVRAENQPQQITLSHTTDSLTMMDITRDDFCLRTAQTMANLPELDLEAHYLDPVTSNEPEVQKLLRMLPDAEYRLKWTYGVEAFQQWCAQRNRSALSSSSSIPTSKNLIKSDLLSYTNADELQHILSIFITETRRPTGNEYLPESIFYLCLGIQEYLNMNNRSIDLFNPCYVEFNSTLNQILSNYSPRLSPITNNYVSLITEDILYDARQLGNLTPWSLLTTLIYINTKYFNLKTVESHMAISFANFGKYSQWGRLATSA